MPPPDAAASQWPRPRPRARALCLLTRVASRADARADRCRGTQSRSAAGWRLHDARTLSVRVPAMAGRTTAHHNTLATHRAITSFQPHLHLPRWPCRRREPIPTRYTAAPFTAHIFGLSYFSSDLRPEPVSGGDHRWLERRRVRCARKERRPGVLPSLRVRTVVVPSYARIRAPKIGTLP